MLLKLKHVINFDTVRFFVFSNKNLRKCENATLLIMRINNSISQKRIFETIFFVQLQFKNENRN